jgi:tetratricopeptide (TPR) repeat protein
MRLRLVLAPVFVLLIPPYPARLCAGRNYYQEALEKYQSKQYPAALAAVRQAVLQDGNNAAHLHLYGLILEALHELGPAEDNLRKAVALAPDQADFQYDLGYLLHQQRNYAEALPVLKRAVELAPENLTARLMLARTYVLSFQQLRIPNFADLALEQLNFIVQRNPRFPSVHHHLGLMYINSGEQTKALEELRTELRYYPDNIQARLEFGETLLRLSQPARAVEQLLIAAQQAPQMHLIHYALAKAYKAEGKTAKAITAARQCVELEPRFGEGHYLLGQLYRDAHQPELAQRHFALFQELKYPAERSP